MVAPMFTPPAPPTVAAPLTKPKGLHCRYVFTTGKHLNIFGVQDINLDGEWYRVIDHKDTLHVINKDLVLYIEQKQVK